MRAAAILLTLLAAGLLRSPAPAQPIDIGSRLELMVDDYLVDQMTGGATLRLHPPVMREVAMVTDSPWEGNACHYRSVFRDGDIYRMYYTGLHYTTGGPESEGLASHPLYICYAESRDGITWTRPELGIAEFNGSTANNIVLAAADVRDAKVDPGHCAVFKDANPNCPADARYKAMVIGSDPSGVYAFKSADGIHFSLMGVSPILTVGAFDSQNLAFWDTVRGEYREYHRGFREGVRDILTATSQDFLRWPEPTWLSYPGAPKEHLYTNQIHPYYRAPHIFIGFPMRYTDRGWSDAAMDLPQPEERLVRASHSPRYGTAVTDGLFMSSRDGLTFKRWGEAFIRPGPRMKDTWTYGDISAAWGVVETASSLPDAPNELSMYVTEGYWTGKSLNVRRYTLRMDGFVSVQTPLSGGEFTTKPIVFDGGSLALNLETSGAGGVCVEVQDANGQPIEGYGLADCPEIRGDAVRHIVRWASGADLRPLAGQPVRLKFVMRDAGLYAFQFVPFEDGASRPKPPAPPG